MLRIPLIVAALTLLSFAPSTAATAAPAAPLAPAAASTSEPQGPIVGGTEQVLRTTWIDKEGNTHEVVTPVPSPTASGMKKAAHRHKVMVATMKSLNP